MSIKYFIRLLKANIAALLLSITLPVLASNHDLVLDTATTIKKIDALMAPWADSNAPGAAVAVRKNGSLIFDKGYGLANLEYDAPMKSDTPSQVGSVSKQFTAFAALLLVDAGKISLDTNIRDVLPEMKNLPQPVLVRHLLDHVSGLRDESTLASMAGWHQDDALIQDQVFALVAQQQGVNFKPDVEYQYNNSNYLLLALIIERVTGQPFSDFMQERIFTPLEMNNSWFADDRFDVVKGRAYSYHPSQSGYVNALLNTNMLGSTGLMTTAKDLTLWAQNFETKKIGSDTVHELMARRAKTLGGEDAVLAKGQERRVYNENVLWCHGGRIAGYRSFLIRVPTLKLAISVLSNRSDFDMAKVAYDILEIIDPLKPSTQMDIASAASVNGPLDGFVGDYRLFKGLVFSFKVVDESVLFSTNQMSAWLPLTRVSANLFLLNKANNTFIEFNGDGVTPSSSLDYVISKNGRLPAKRVSVANVAQLEIDLAQYQGEYWSRELNTKYTIDVRDNRLFAVHQRLAPIELFVSAEDTFDARSNNFMQVEFVIDDATVQGMSMSHAVANDVWFERLNTE